MSDHSRPQTATPNPVPGRLVLMPNALDLGAPTCPPLGHVLPHGVIALAARLTHWVVEDAKSARVFLKRVAEIQPLAVPLQAMQMVELPRPQKGGGAPRGAAARPSLVAASLGSASGAPSDPWATLLAPAAHGHDIGLLSEAGLPAVADPGSALVAAAHSHCIAVVALPGASSITLAMAASGLQGQCFAFVGYLPQDAAMRTARLHELQAHSRRWQQTQLLIETPYRNETLMLALLRDLDPTTRLSVSVGLTLPEASTRMATVAQWRKRPLQLPHKTPAVFAFLA